MTSPLHPYDIESEGAKKISIRNVLRLLLPELIDTCFFRYLQVSNRMANPMRLCNRFTATAMLLGLAASLAFAIDGKKVLYLTGCNDTEVISDIRYSIEGFSRFASKHNIQLISNKGDKNKCGYILIFNEKKKTVNSSLTDVDSVTICRDFFTLKNSVTMLSQLLPVAFVGSIL